MYTLTEQMVQAQIKESDLGHVKQFKCWGQNLRDVSIVTRMSNVEKLMFSINELTTLEPFAHCKKLKELYIKKNMITDINELRHLKNLPDLKVLWLDGNPCCKIVGDNYRKIVLSTLPHLKRLDDVDVLISEVEEALRCGLEVKYKQAQHLSTQDMPQQCKSRSNSNLREETMRLSGGEERPIKPAKNGNSSYQLDYNYSKPNHDSQAKLSQWSQQNEPRECTSNYRSNLSVREKRTESSASKDRSKQNVNTSYQDDYPPYSKPNHDSQATLSQWSQQNEPRECTSNYRSNLSVREKRTECSASKDRSKQNVNTSYQDDYPPYSKPNHDSQATLSQWSQQNEPRECTSNYRSNLSVREERTECSASKDRSTQNVNTSYQDDYPPYSKPNHDSQATLSQWSQQNEPRECTSNYRSNLSVREKRTGCSASKDRSKQNVNTSYQDDYPPYSKPNHDSQATLSQWSQKVDPQDYKCRSKQSVEDLTYSAHRDRKVATRCSDMSQCNDMPERCSFGDDDASKSDIGQKMEKRDNSPSIIVLSGLIMLLNELDSDSLGVLRQEIRHHIRMKKKQ